MSDAQWSAVFLIVTGAVVTLVFLANYNLPGNALLPGRTERPISYWGTIVFSVSFALFGLYGLVIGL